MLVVAFLVAPLPWLLGAAVGVAAAAAGSRRRSPYGWCEIVRTRTDGPSLNGALARTGMLQLVFCVLLSAGLLAS